MTQLINSRGTLTQWGSLLADLLREARGRRAARLSKQLITEYGASQVTDFINKITEYGRL